MQRSCCKTGARDTALYHVREPLSRYLRGGYTGRLHWRLFDHETSGRGLLFACGPEERDVMLNRLSSSFAVLVAAGLLSACSVLPGTGPNSDAVNAYPTAALRSNAALPYALVDISADTIVFLSQPNLVTFQGAFPDKGPKPYQVAGIGDVL